MTTLPVEISTTSSAPPEESITGPFNIASYLPQMAAAVPDQAAVVVTAAYDSAGNPIYKTLTFAELEALSNRYANALQRAGWTRGMRALLMVRPGFTFTALVFAMFKVGIVPVMIDPGMGVRRMLQCIRTVDLHGFIGIPLAHAMRVLRRRAFASVERIVTVGRRWFWGGPTLSELVRGASDRFAPAETDAGETAAILFTSGSTGPAKGVVYAHGMFGAQVRMIQAHYEIEPGESDLPTFPLFALFSTAMGMTAVIPVMDPARPARVDPRRIVEAIRDHGVTSTFGSPALWERVANYCVDHGITLPSLRRVLIAGAPVPYPVIERLHSVLADNADVHTPYGATESLPVSSISGHEVLTRCREKSRRGAGTCVGRPVPGAAVRIIRITDDPIPRWSPDLIVPQGVIGEMIVSGPAVTHSYFNLPEATAASKIREGDSVWHRIGDVGYRDDTGRIWFCGRKAHRVITKDGVMFTVPCEAVFNEHPQVARSALVEVGPRGRQRPVIVIEPTGGRVPRRRRAHALRTELLALARANRLTERIEDVLFHPSLPVDVRHNAKINREALAKWAASKLP